MSRWLVEGICGIKDDKDHGQRAEETGTFPPGKRGTAAACAAVTLRRRAGRQLRRSDGQRYSLTMSTKHQTLIHLCTTYINISILPGPPSSTGCSEMPFRGMLHRGGLVGEWMERSSSGGWVYNLRRLTLRTFGGERS